LDPFIPVEKDGKLFGLGSNDAGASLVAMAQTFLYFYEAEDLTHNLVIALTAEKKSLVWTELKPYFHNFRM
jgi:acetylornithine deacetylase